MKVLLKRNLTGALCALLSLCVIATTATAQKKSKTSRMSKMQAMSVKDPKRAKDAARHSQDAAKVFSQLMNTPERGVPKDLLDKAEAIAVFPGVVKAGFIVGGRGGQGVISRRLPNGWSAPAFFNIGGADFGAQIGASKTDFVLLFMNENAVSSLLKDKVELGGELSIAAGPYGRTAAASTDALAQAGILSYSRSKGAFIGAVVKGGTINPDNDLNEAIYGMKAMDFLTGTQKMTMTTMPSVVRIFPQTLARYSVR